MLNGPIWKNQSGADGADAAKAGIADHLAEPFGLTHFGVIVQEQQEISLDSPDRLIVQPGIIEFLVGAGETHDLAAIGRIPQVGKCRRIIAVVVDHDNLEIRISRLG
jgi:hypothetical protein